MPSWKIHDKWAEKMGVLECSRYVSNLIDAIEEGKTLPQEYLDFVKEYAEREQERSKKSGLAVVIFKTALKHDAGRRKKKGVASIAGKIQLKFLRQKGVEYLRAWYLHHMLDDLSEWESRLDGERCIKTTKYRTTVCLNQDFDQEIKTIAINEAEIVAEFVTNNLEEIILDCKEYKATKKTESRIRESSYVKDKKHGKFAWECEDAKCDFVKDPKYNPCYYCPNNKKSEWHYGNKP